MENLHTDKLAGAERVKTKTGMKVEEAKIRKGKGMKGEGMTSKGATSKVEF